MAKRTKAGANEVAAMQAMSDAGYVVMTKKPKRTKASYVKAAKKATATKRRKARGGIGRKAFNARGLKEMALRRKKTALLKKIKKAKAELKKINAEPVYPWSPTSRY